MSPQEPARATTHGVTELVQKAPSLLRLVVCRVLVLAIGAKLERVLGVVPVHLVVDEEVDLAAAGATRADP